MSVMSVISHYTKRRGLQILIYAIVFINIACLIYTIGVWSEKIQKKLKGWHVCVFWGGLIFDNLGTGGHG